MRKAYTNEETISETGVGRAQLGVGVAASLLSSGDQTPGFLNDLTSTLWPKINAAVGALIKETCEPMFKEYVPEDWITLCFEKIDLGRVPFVFDNVDFFPKSKGVVKFNMDVIWDGECDVDLRAGSLAAGVEKVKLRGRVSVILAPLLDRMPVVSAAQVAFINPPHLELKFTGVASVADMKIMDEVVRKIIHEVLASILVLPNRFLVKMDPLNDYLDAYEAPLGFARITAVEGRGFQIQKKMGVFRDVPDIYLEIHLGANSTWRTSVQNDNLTPVWNESADFLLSDHDQSIAVEAFDKDLVTKDDFLGRARTTVNAVLLSDGERDLELEGTHASISLRCEIYRFTQDLSSFSCEKHQGEHVACGLMTVIVTRAWGLPGPKKEAASQVILTFGEQSFQTPIIVDAPGVDPLNPYYDCPFHIPLRTEDVSDHFPLLAFSIKNRDTVLGTFGAPLELVLEAPGKVMRKKQNVGGMGVSLEFCITVRGIVPAKNDVPSKLYS